MSTLLLLLVCGCESKEGEPFRGPRTPAPDAEVAPALDPQLASLLPEGFTLDMVREGRRVYDAGCIVCHGRAGEGTQLGPSLRDTQWIHPSGEPGEVAEIIRTGIAEPLEYSVPMPPLAPNTLRADEIRALSAYVLALRHGAE